MAETQAIRKIIWAVDPCAEDAALQRTAAQAIRSLTQGRDVSIEPVYIWGSYLLAVADGEIEEIRESVKQDAEKSLNAITKKAKLQGLLPLTVLVEPYSDTQRDAGELVAYAKKTQADLIVVSTHARRGPKRWFVGSFAETLMLSSDVPLLIVNPRLRRGRVRDILFPTDFSVQSYEAFKQVIGLAAALGQRIEIFHKVDLPLTPGTEVAFYAHPNIVHLFEEDVEARKRQAEEWAKLAAQHGVTAKIHFETRVMGSAAESILKYVKKKPTLIAMASHSGRLASVYLGSTSRRVVRAADVPVWVIHPKPKAEEPVLSITESEVMDELTKHGRSEAA